MGFGAFAYPVGHVTWSSVKKEKYKRNKKRYFELRVILSKVKKK
jgi:hypothetical protein